MNAKNFGHQVGSKAQANGLHSAFSCRGNGLVSFRIPNDSITSQSQNLHITRVTPPSALYSYPEVCKILGWCSRTVRMAARRIGKAPYSKFFTGEEVKRMAVGG